MPNTAFAHPGPDHRPVAAPWLRWTLLFGFAALMNGCASWLLPFGEYSPPEPLEQEAEANPAVHDLSRHRFALPKDDNIVGQLGVVEVRDGDTLPDIARHFGLGYEEIGTANPGLDMWVPRAGSRAVLPLRFVLPDAPRKGIVVNLAAMRLFLYGGKGGEVVTYPVGIGKEGRSTPTGDMYVARKAEKPVWYVPESIRRDHEKRGDPLPAAVSPGPDNPLGAYAMYLSKPSYLIHGTNKPYAIGLRASNGCLRLYPENIDLLYRQTPVKTPVRIVNQPYLLGWHKGQLYLEAHEPHEELNAKALQATLQAKLKEIEKKGHALDWPKIEATVAEARGIPVPVFAHTPGVEQLARQAVPLTLPEQLYGQPPVPRNPTHDGWYVEALESGDALTAQRTAAVLNHMGPQIPARAVALPDGNQRVLAGPFEDAKRAQAAARQMLLDLDIKGKIMPPQPQRLTSK
ncbi:L,D-transpeptidase family protein [Methylomagnum ishizawai]|uniref:L,D-transpeptidase family protein n=1 Tax=Methylomagnum ishizawai TaxID=1760988 RepID=UPI001C3383E6|nr:L,D-transpeptidase family protein [Methylomagnum ishizawai]BBL76847.1 transpeptidase [Methylomagnum ishizawai]